MSDQKLDALLDHLLDDDFKRVRETTRQVIHEYVASIRVDSERLDWLEENEADLMGPSGDAVAAGCKPWCVVIAEKGFKEGDTPRSAIDAARTVVVQPEGGA